MLTLPWMGLFALIAFWVNVLLIAMAAWVSLRALQRRASALVRPGVTLLSGVIEEGLGEGGAFAQRIVEQTGRAVTRKGPRSILFIDGKDLREVFGGTVRVDGSARRMTPSPEALLWSEPARATRLHADFEAAWAEASTSRGVRLQARDVLQAGQPVWLLVDASGAMELVATMDPRRELSRAMRLLGLLIALTVLPAVGITALLLTPPLFGPLSTLGGVLALAFFLAIQPIAVAMQAKAQLPDAQRVGGLWQP